MNALFRKLEANHPKLADLGPRSQDIKTVLNASASILDALLPGRNQASVAHPNDSLLGEAGGQHHAQRWEDPPQLPRCQALLTSRAPENSGANAFFLSALASWPNFISHSSYLCVLSDYGQSVI